MNESTIQGLRGALRARRERLFAEVAEAEEDLRWLAEDRESELEERAQEERLARLLARLDDRGKVEIEEIDEALRRMSRGTYGVCEGCGGEIGDARLAALPAARLCIDCARDEERSAREYAPRVVAPPPRCGPVPPDLGELSDAELTTWLRELVREDGRVDAAEIKILCRHGVVHLEGTLPSTTEHSILLGLVEDVAGLSEIEDRLEIREVIGQREEEGTAGRKGAAPGAAASGGTEDVVASIEEGESYTPPTGPSPDEE